MIAWLCVRRRIPPRLGRCRGVTVVDLVTLVALLVILAALAVPTISPIVLRYRVRGAAWQVAGDLRLARQRAVTIKRRFKFCLRDCSVPVPAGSYSVEREDAPGSGTFLNENGVATTLPPQVTITATAAPTFTITGTAGGATVTLSNLLGSYQVRVAPSGRVLVCEGTCTP